MGLEGCGRGLNRWKIMVWRIHVRKVFGGKGRQKRGLVRMRREMGREG